MQAKFIYNWDESMYINSFLEYEKIEKQATKNTLLAYRSDIVQLEKFLQGIGVFSLLQGKNAHIIAFITELKDQKKSKATINRKLVSIRAFYNYLYMQKGILHNPTKNIKLPKTEKNKVEVLSISEIEEIIASIDDSYKGKRDKAIIELLYGTGIRASELVELKISDINMSMGFLSCSTPKGKTRVLPLGNLAKRALEEYLEDSYSYFDQRSKSREVENKKIDIVFLSNLGEKITRQGLWKIVKKYESACKTVVELTPNILRNSFAIHLLENGADIKTVQDLMGVESISLYKDYLEGQNNRVKEVYNNAHPRA